jgi:hypothetical protein
VLDGLDVYQGPVEVIQHSGVILSAVDLKFWNSNGHSPDQDPCNKTWDGLSIFQLPLHFTSICIQQTVLDGPNVYRGPVEVIQHSGVIYICRGLEILELKRP